MGQPNAKSTDLMSAKSNTADIPAVQNYLDYRQFIIDCVEAISANEPKFSVRELARRAELSPSFVSYILRKKRNLNEEAAQKVCAAFNLNEQQARYFELIRQLEIEKSHKKKTELFRDVEKMRAQMGYANGHDPFYAYYSDWVSVVIRELSHLKGFSLDATKIKKAFKFKTSLSNVKSSIKSLFSIGYLRKGSNGELESPVGLIDCDGKVFKLAIREFHTQMLDRAKESLTKLTPEHRRISGMTMPVSKQQFEKIVELIKKFEAELKEIEEMDMGDKTRVINVTQFAITLAEIESQQDSENTSNVISFADKKKSQEGK